jgi:gas vesicle protein
MLETGKYIMNLDPVKTSQELQEQQKKITHAVNETVSETVKESVEEVKEEIQEHVQEHTKGME